MTERERSERVRAGLDPALSSTEIRLTHRKFKRYLTVVVLGVFALPLFSFLTLVFMPRGSTDSVAGVLGILAVMLLTVLLALLPFILVGGFVAAVVWSVVKHKRMAAGRDVLTPRAAWFPTNEGADAAGQPAGSGLAGLGLRDAAPHGEGPPEAEFAGDIALLETLRADMVRIATRKLRIYVPATAAAIVLFWFGTGFGQGGQGSPLIAFVLMVCLPTGFVWIWIRHDAQIRYGKAFKEGLMPRLVGRYGDLRYGSLELPPLAALVGFGVLPAYEAAEVDDGIHGSYRGHRVRIAELVLKARSKNEDKGLVEVYRGLLVDFETPQPFVAATVVIDKMAPMMVRHSLERQGLERVRLEDPLFDEIYTVFGTDQIAARAFLTPAAMQRLLVMGDGQAFYPPTLLARGEHVSFVTRRWDNKDLFEPPSLFSHDAAQQLLVQERDLANVFLLIDAMTTVQGVGPRRDAQVSSDHTQTWTHGGG